MRRAELHLHTKMSDLDGVDSIENYCRVANDLGISTIAVTDHGNVQSLKEAFESGERYNIKIIYGCELYMVDDIADGNKKSNSKPMHVIALAKNKRGLEDLFELITLSHTISFDNGLPLVPKSVLSKFRSNLLLGSACYNGEVFYNACYRDNEHLKKAISFYDYIEIQPLDCYPRIVSDERELKNIVKKIIDVAEELHKTAVVTGDVHYLSSSNKICRDVLISIASRNHPLKEYVDKGFTNPNQHLRSTEEMLDDMSWLGKEKAYEYVVANSNKIADMVETYKPISDDKCYLPVIEHSDETLKDICFKRAQELYGDTLPNLIKERLGTELNGIIKNGYSSIVYSFYEIVKKAHDNGYLTSTRGMSGSSLVLFLLGISNVNPLPPHYYCKKCHHFELAPSFEDGYDLPYKECPICGGELTPDGHNIPYELFLGLDAEKLPDIDLNVDVEWQHMVQIFVQDYFGKQNVVRAGTTYTIWGKTALGLVEKYIETSGTTIDDASIEEIANNLVGCKRATGQLPRGLVILPKNHKWNEFTPLQYPANYFESSWMTTHLDYYQLNHSLYKMDILGSCSLTRLMNLEKLTGVNIEDIDLNNPDLRKILTNQHDKVNNLGIPEFDTEQMYSLFADFKPNSIRELIQICGLIHGTDTLQVNSNNILQISNRDDFYLYLLNHGISKNNAYEITNDIRRGKGLTLSNEKMMRDNNIPEDIIEACKTIKYLFPKAHIIEYIRIALSFAFYKLHNPLEFSKIN